MHLTSVCEYLSIGIMQDHRSTVPWTETLSGAHARKREVLARTKSVKTGSYSKTSTNLVLKKCYTSSKGTNIWAKSLSFSVVWQHFVMRPVKNEGSQDFSSIFCHQCRLLTFNEQTLVTDLMTYTSTVLIKMKIAKNVEHENQTLHQLIL